ncbi:outer membrane protein assembly factor BamC [Thiobacter aerophilum]|uniref:Outer membrane protein assembly factor BamC n=1 Tax=Thiobacter aerophilum TaxID=3121275 RepID=A0ABV0EDU3_9BURK
MKRGIKSGMALLLIATLSIGGCSMSLETKKIDYKSAGKIPPLDVPPDLTATTPDDRYVVPDVTPRGSATLSAYQQERQARPTTANATAGNLLPDLANVRVERAGNQRWLVVKAPPEQVWPVVRDFWQELGFIIKTEQPEAGIMETDWAENRAKIPQDFIRNILGKVLDSLYSTAERDKFRTRLEPGKEPGTTEVYISHRGMYEVLEGGDGGQRTIWQPRPPDPELEAEMLRRLMVRFGVEESRSKTLLATSKDVDRARLDRRPDGSASLVLDDAFDRAWRRVGLALDRVGFTVVDRDRSQGLYYVRYLDPEAEDTKKKDDGWFSKLAFWRSRDKQQKPEEFRVRVTEVNEATRVAIEDKQGAPDKSETASKILNLLYEQLK